MSTYTFTFTFTPDKIGIDAGTPGVTVTFDDTEQPFIESVMNAFEQFLLGCTFQPESIRKYLDADKVQKNITKVALAVAEYKAKHGIK